MFEIELTLFVAPAKENWLERCWTLQKLWKFGKRAHSARIV